MNKFYDYAGFESGGATRKTMTTQEYVKKEAEKYAAVQVGDPAKFENNDQINKYESELATFADGLSAGIELNEDFAVWVVVNKWEYDTIKLRWYNKFIRECAGMILSRQGLFELYLTKRNEK